MGADPYTYFIIPLCPFDYENCWKHNVANHNELVLNIV